MRLTEVANALLLFCTVSFSFSRAVVALAVCVWHINIQVQVQAIQSLVPLDKYQTIVFEEKTNRLRNAKKLLHEPNEGYKITQLPTACSPALPTTLLKPSRWLSQACSESTYLSNPHCGMWVISDRSCFLGLSKLVALFCSLRLLFEHTNTHGEGMHKGGGELHKTQLATY